MGAGWLRLRAGNEGKKREKKKRGKERFGPRKKGRLLRHHPAKGSMLWRPTIGGREREGKNARRVVDLLLSGGKKTRCRIVHLGEGIKKGRDHPERRGKKKSKMSIKSNGFNSEGEKKDRALSEEKKRKRKVTAWKGGKNQGESLSGKGKRAL